MTLRELSQLYWLKKELKHCERRLAEKRANMRSLSSPNLDGLPPGSDGVSSMQRYIECIQEIEQEIKRRKSRIEQEILKLEQYISTIDDSVMRQIFILRFIELKSWVSVAYHLGGNNTSDSVRKQCYRYINRHNK